MGGQTGKQGRFQKRVVVVIKWIVCGPACPGIRDPAPRGRLWIAPQVVQRQIHVIDPSVLLRLREQIAGPVIDQGNIAHHIAHFKIAIARHKGPLTTGNPRFFRNDKRIDFVDGKRSIDGRAGQTIEQGRKPPLKGIICAGTSDFVIDHRSKTSRSWSTGRQGRL